MKKKEEKDREVECGLINQKADASDLYRRVIYTVVVMDRRPALISDCPGSQFASRRTARQIARRRVVRRSKVIVAKFSLGASLL